MPPNQNPEQSARDRIDAMLGASGWVVQDKKAINFNAGPGIAVREYRTTSRNGCATSCRSSATAAA